MDARDDIYPERHEDHEPVDAELYGTLHSKARQRWARRQLQIQCVEMGLEDDDADDTES